MDRFFIKYKGVKMGIGNLYKQISEYSIVYMIAGLDQYSSSWPLKKICNAIEVQDDAFGELLYSMDQCGALDMLTILCEIVDLFCLETTKTWFYSLLQACSEAKNVIRLKNLYRQKKRTETKNLMGNLSFEPSSAQSIDCTLTTSVEAFENFIWENLEFDYLRKIGRTDPKNIGVWYSGLYAREKKETYLKKLESHVFPRLIAESLDSIELGNEDAVVSAIVKKRIVDYLVELALVYYSEIEKTLKPVADVDPNTLAKMDYKEFCALLQDSLLKVRQDRIYISDLLLDELQSLLRIYEYFGISLHRESVTRMRSFFPLFYQMLGKEDDALTFLIDQIKSADPAYRVHNRFLLPFYRGLLVTSNEAKRQRLISIFDEIYLDQSGIREFQAVAEDITKFYKKHAESFCERKSFLWKYEEPFLGDVDHYVFTKWFKEKAVVNMFSELLIRVLYKSDWPQHEAITDFITLFYSLTSHRDSEIRIHVSVASGILDPDVSFNDFEEVFGIYSKEEQELICHLAERMEKTIVHMPHESMVRLYCRLKDQAQKFWKNDPETVLCEKLMVAFRGIQSDFYNNGNAEDALNNSVAFFLRAYYGEENVHREEPQGTSGKGQKSGETDILVYQNGTQLALLEGVVLSSLDKKKLNDHMDRLLVKYNTQGVPYTVLVIYAKNVPNSIFFDKVEMYLQNYRCPYPIMQAVVREKSATATICHHTLSYVREGTVQKMHVFTVRMD